MSNLITDAQNLPCINLSCLDDKNLSWDAKGMLICLLTRKEIIDLKQLSSLSSDNISLTKNKIQELVENHYLFEVVKKNDKSQTGYYVSEIPTTSINIQQFIDSEYELLKREDK